ncbi:MAG: hypothetical protein KDA25_00625 [Phycisphaerales bacterium]|nr:hypothetical protein [Phycisphaerales bacterium]
MPEFEHPPIARHDALAPLSRDHYGGLVQARHLIRAADGDDVARRKAIAQFVDAWDREIAEHFRDEERLLGALMDEADRRRLLDEHARLSALASEARTMRRHVDPDPSALRQLGEALEQHIRWEERHLFNRLQDRLGAARLAELQRQSARLEASRPRHVKRTP